MTRKLTKKKKKKKIKRIQYFVYEIQKSEVLLAHVRVIHEQLHRYIDQGKLCYTHDMTYPMEYGCTHTASICTS